MSDLELGSSVYIHYSFEFTMCRLLDALLLPSTIRVKADVNIIDEELVELALRKINYWLDEYVTAAIAIPATDLGLSLVLNENNAPRLQNHLMITPDHPTDEHLCLLFQSKLQALAAGAFAVGMVEITSDNGDGLTFTYIGDSEDMLPTMSEWITGPTWFDEPWWLRDDASTFDTVAQPDADLNVKPAWAVDLSFLAREMAPQEAIIMTGNFSPRIIEDPEDDS